MRRLALCTLLLAALASAGCAFSLTFLSPNLKLHVTNVTAVPDTIRTDGEAALTASVDNPAGGAVTYVWAAHQGTVVGTGSKVRYLGATCCLSTDVVAVTVKNARGETDTRLITMTVIQPPAP